MTVLQPRGMEAGSQPWGSTSGLRLQWGTILFVTSVFVLATVSLDGLFWKEAQPSILQARLDSIEHGMLTRRIALIVLGASALMGLLRTSFAGIRARGMQSVLLVVAAVLLLSSVAWADEPNLVLRKAVVQVLLWAGAMWVGLRLTSGGLVKLTLVGAFFTIALGVLVEVANGVFTPWAPGYRLMGFVHPNQTGEYAGFAFLAAVGLAFHSSRRRPWYSVLAAAALALLVLTRSRTALLATTVALLVLLWSVTSRLSRGRAIPVALLSAAAGLLCLLQILGVVPLHELVPQLLSLGRGDSDLATLTERTPLWHELITKYIAARPFLGYGFEGFWTSGRIIELSLLRPGHVYFHSHSGYIEMALGIGIPGALCWTIGILLCLREGLRDYRRFPSPDNAMVLAALAYVVTSMLTEASLFSIGLSSFVAIVCVVRQSFVAHGGTTQSPLRAPRPTPIAIPSPAKPALRL